MRRELIALAGAFVVSASLASLATGCFDDCTCDPTPARPEVQAALSGLEVASYDRQGGAAELLVEPANGTLEVTGDTVVIRYQQGDAQHEVVYDILGTR
jgi:hypothetical protein